ncbi:MAG TPA: ribosome biogenesis GTPase Der [Thermoanaerobaculia bacterium]|jgi:GTP-binding protein|nr:ribosome biogenesis GTPase Der [Thermoanaerobaculia bacterium]
MSATVAIVGRPNVGKSTLFNRLVGKRQAIVHDQPGVTRDRIVGSAEIADGHRIELVDTGGLALAGDALGLSRQVFLAVEESDLLLLVVDGREGLLGADRAVWEALRPYGKQVLLVVNKADTRAAREGQGEFWELGIPDVHLVSAEHGAGIAELREALAARVAAVAAPPPPVAPPIAIVGRPNVGKSSLLNRLVGETRVLVSPLAGTTRDPIDTMIEHEGKPYLLIDTAGIRRRAQASGAPEELAVMMARRQIERAEVVLLLIDASQGITSGDLAIGGTIWELGRAAVVVINKWDLLDAEGRRRLEEQWPRLQELLADPPRVNLSATSGRGVTKLLPQVAVALAGFHARLGTGEVNRLFEQAVRAHAPPSRDGREWKLYYATQVGEGPPTFMLFANRTLPRNDPYRRYLANRVREALGLAGVPVRLVVRRRGDRGKAGASRG